MQVTACTFGSVPLKTYLPDGDIDLSIFTPQHSLRDTWAIKLQGALEEEARSSRTLLKIGDVHVINAEVKGYVRVRAGAVRPVLILMRIQAACASMGTECPM